MKADEDHQQSAQEFAAGLAARSAPEVAATIVAATAVKAEAAAQEALGDANLQRVHVEERLRTDATLQGLPHMDEEQTKAMAESIRSLVDQQLRAMNKSREQRFATCTFPIRSTWTSS